jgi:putative lipoprotein
MAPGTLAILFWRTTMPSARFLLLALLPVFAGCQMFDSEPEKTPVPVVRMQGELSAVDNRLQFRPCQEQRHFILEDTASTGLLQESAALLNNGKGTLFADLEGQMTASKTSGTDGQINLTRLYRIQNEGQNCNDLNFKRLTIRASGHEPDWVINANHEGLILERPGQESLVLPYLEEQLPEGRFNLSSAANGHLLELWVAPQRCIDSMSGSVQHLSAELRLDGKVMRGCAYYGGARQD